MRKRTITLLGGYVRVGVDPGSHRSIRAPSRRPSGTPGLEPVVDSPQKGASLHLGEFLEGHDVPTRKIRNLSNSFDQRRRVSTSVDVFPDSFQQRCKSTHCVLHHEWVLRG